MQLDFIENEKASFIRANKIEFKRTLSLIAALALYFPDSEILSFFQHTTMSRCKENIHPKYAFQNHLNYDDSSQAAMSITFIH